MKFIETDAHTWISAKRIVSFYEEVPNRVRVKLSDGNYYTINMAISSFVDVLMPPRKAPHIPRSYEGDPDSINRKRL